MVTIWSLLTAYPDHWLQSNPVNNSVIITICEQTYWDQNDLLTHLKLLALNSRIVPLHEKLSTLASSIPATYALANPACFSMTIWWECYYAVFDRKEEKCLKDDCTVEITKVTATKYKSRPWSQIECSNANALHWAEEISTCKLLSELQWFILHHAFETDLYSPASRGKLIGLHTVPVCNI